MKLHAYKPRILELLKQRPPASDLGREVGAGLTVGMIALPLALALGIASIPAGADTPYFRKVRWLVEHARSFDMLTLLVGAVSCAIIYYWPRLGWKRILGSIVAVAIPYIWMHCKGLPRRISALMPCG